MAALTAVPLCPSLARFGSPPSLPGFGRPSTSVDRKRNVVGQSPLNLGCRIHCRVLFLEQNWQLNNVLESGVTAALDADVVDVILAIPPCSQSAPKGFSEDGVVLFNCQRSDLAAEIESNTCPICFELMKSPDYPPIVLSPCGHSFCAKCLSVHVGSQRKKLCPYCRQKIASTAVNLSLQRLIDSFVNLQDRRHQTTQADHDKELFLDRLSAAETRSCILRNELAEALERKRSSSLTSLTLISSTVDYSISKRGPERDFGGLHLRTKQ